MVSQSLQNASRKGKAAVPVVVVPFMGEMGRRLCQAAAGVSWFDLSGNAEIVAPGQRSHIEGKAQQVREERSALDGILAA
jgi:hypothetical protein